MLYAHYDKQTKQGQLLGNHLQHVGERMILRIAAISFPGILPQRLQHLLYYTGLFHDAAKAMLRFQRYLKTGRGGLEKNHALLSAAIGSQSAVGKNDVYTYLSILAIARHHGDLEQSIMTKGQLFSQLKEQYRDYCKQMQDEDAAGIFIPAASITPNVFMNRFKDFIEEFKFDIQDLADAEDNGEECMALFFLLQYLFSKLIWADKLDSAGIPAGPFRRDCTLLDIEEYIHKKNQHIVAVDETREVIRQCVLQRIDDLTAQQFQHQRIYLLTAPTGTGKTLTSICAAMKISERMEKLYHEPAYIITAMPFINIIEQTLADYEQIFGKSNVLAQYGAADLKQCEKEGDETNSLQRNMLLLSSWEKPVIVTTFVQLFESMLGNENKRLIKLNKLAGSVIILDEIQALPSEQYALLGAVLYYVSLYYGTRFILMTATQPEIVAFAAQILGKDKMHAYELLPGYREYYRGLRRTRLIPVFDQVQDNEQLVSFIVETRQADAAALVVVNTISQSIEVYQLLKERGVPVLYLSTNLMPVDRKKVIQVAQRLLKRRYPFILVSTQTIEAGVDLDFDIAYRDFAPLESIIQVAGRVNRSGSKGEHLPVYVFRTNSSQYVYGTYFRQETQRIFDEFGSVGEEEYLKLIHRYYEILSQNMVCPQDYVNAMKSLDYEKISQFHLIAESGDVKTVLFLCNQRVEKLVADYILLLQSFSIDFDTKVRLRQQLNELSRYTVEVRISKLIRNQPCRFSDIFDVNLDWYVVQSEEIKNYYNRTGFISENPTAFEY